MNRRLFLFLLFPCIILLGAGSRTGQTPEKAMKDANTDNPFGVLEFLHWNHEWNKHRYNNYAQLDRAVALLKDAGVGWVRMDFVWEDIESRQGRFDFRKYDYLVDLLSKNNIRLLGILDYSAPWASSCGEWNCAPSDPQAFVLYASIVVDRYKDKVKHWEIWNEPDSYTYWKQQDGLKGYCDLLKKVYTALKRVDPDCKVLNGGFSNAIVSINKLYDNGAKDYFDILNIHIFESPLNPGATTRLTPFVTLAKKIMDRNGDSHKKLWITEIGCPGVRRGLKAANWWMGKNPNERQQAAWVKDVYTKLLTEPVVERVFWAFFRDTDEFWRNGTDHFGLVRFDFRKKPSFTAYKKCFMDWKKKNTFLKKPSPSTRPSVTPGHIGLAGVLPSAR